MGNNGITDALAAYAAEMSYEKLDPETIRVQKYSLLDAIACMAAATGVEGDWNRFAEFAVSQGTGECSLIGRNEKVSPSMAALANGALMHAMDFDSVKDYVSVDYYMPRYFRKAVFNCPGNGK